MAIVKRLVKGSALTHAELDGNFTDLDGRVTTLEGTTDNDNQTLSFASTTLSISGGNSVDLSSLTGTSYTDADVNTHLNQSTATANQVLSWNGSDYAWVAQTTGYGDTNVNAHLNQSTATANQVLSWNGSDYAWVAQTNSGSTFDQSLNTTDGVTFAAITSTGGNTFSGGTTTIRTNSTNTWPNHSAPLAIENTGSNTTAFQMNVAGSNDIVVANNNGSFVVRNYDTGTDIITVSSAGTVTATAFVGDGSGLTNLPSGGIALTDLSVTVASASGTGNLAYNNITGEFTYTPPIVYTDSAVDLHLRTTSASANEYLFWDGSDYQWQTIPTLNVVGDVNYNSVTLDGSNGQGKVLAWDQTLTAFVPVDQSGGGSSYTDSDVDTHLNTSTATANQILSWTGTDYAWVADQTGGGGGVLSLTGHEPAVNFDFTGDGSVFAADSLDYAEFAGGESKTEASALASDSMRSSWSPISGAVYTNNQFGLYLMKGNANDALIESVGGSVNGWGDTILFGNVNDDGTSARMTSGLGITGNQVYLRTDGTEGDIKIRNTNANGNGEIDLFMGTSSTLAAYSRIKLTQDTITMAGFEANVTISDNTLGDLEIKKGTLGVSDAWVIGIDDANTEASSLVTFNVDGNSIWSATGTALTVNPTTTFNGEVNILGGNNLTVGTVGGETIQVDGTGVLFSGTTFDANTTTLTVTDPTAVRTITLPDASGTVALLSDISGSSYGDSDVDAHLNQTNPTAGYVLSWNGSDYAWVVNGTGTGLGDVVDDTTPQLGGNLDLNGNDITGTGNIAISGFLGVGTVVQFEGSTSDAFETTLTVTDPTADRTVTIPDATGEVVLRQEYGPGTNLYVDLLADTELYWGNTTNIRANDTSIDMEPGNSKVASFESSGLVIALTKTIKNQRNTNVYTTLRFDGTVNDPSNTIDIPRGDGVIPLVNSNGALELPTTTNTGTKLESIKLSGTNFTTTLDRTDATAARTITLPDASGTVALTSDLGSLQNLTTTQRDALTPSDGDIIYNTSNSQFELYTNTSWAAMTKVVYNNLLPSSDFVDQITNIWSANPTTPADFATWAQTIASDGFEYGNIDLSTTPPTIRSVDSLHWLNISTNNNPDPAHVTRWLDIVLPSLIEQSWFDVHTSNLVTGNVFSRVSDDTTPVLGGNLDADGKNIENLGQVQIGQLGSVVFEGFSVDTFETTLTVVDPTADRTIYLPDATGFVALTSDIPTAYTDSDVDTHLNTSTATTGQILSWNGSDYAWVADQTGAGGGTLTITGYNPAVDYDIDASGTGGELNDGLEYGRLASGSSAATSTGALGSSSLIPSWTALTGSVYNDNRFGLNVVRGNNRDSQRVSVGLTPEGYGDTFALGNIDNDGTNIKLFSGLGVSGPDVYLRTEADQAVISIDNDSTNGTIRINNNNGASEILLLSGGTITMTGNTSISGTLTAGVITTTGLVVNDGTAAMVFEGDTADNFETTVTFTDPTVDRTITFPNASGNVALNSVDAQTGQFLSWTHNFRSGSTQTVEIDNTLGFTAHDNIFIDNMSGGDEMTVVFTQAAGTATSMILKDGDRSNVAIALQGTIGLNTNDVTIVKVLDTGTIKYAWVVAAF